MTVIQTKDGAAALLQLKAVTLLGQFLLGEVGSVEAESFANNGHAQGITFKDGKTQPLRDENYCLSLNGCVVFL